MGILVTMLVCSCRRPQVRPLNEKELLISIVGNEQDTSIRLQKECNKIPGIFSFESDYDIRIAAVSKNANTAQILYRHSYEYTGSYYSTKSSTCDVRFWSCPDVVKQATSGHSIESLINDLKNEDVQVRRNAALALGEVKDNQSVEPLIAALKDNDWVVRWKVVWALGEQKDNRAIKPLIALIDDEKIRLDVVIALEKITGESLNYLEYDPIKWQKWWKKNKNKLFSDK